MKNQFYNAHHSPIGAFASFTLGYKGNKGGFGLELDKAADQDIYVGLESVDGTHFDAFPFFSGSNDEASRYDVENQGQSTDTKESPQTIVPLCDDQITRDLKLGSDTFTSKELSFTIYSPTKGIPDPQTADKEALRKVLLPAVLIEVTIDNRHCDKDRRAFFGFSGNDPYTGIRRFDDVSEGAYSGVGQGRHLGLMSNSDHVTSASGFTLEKILSETLIENHTFGLGATGTLLFQVPANEITTYKIVACFYRDAYVTAGLDTKYYYTTLFNNIEEVGIYAMENFDTLKQACIKSDELLAKETLSDDQRFMMIQSIRSYYGSTQLLINDDQPFFIVNEGEYRMMNTFDLTVDQLFFEMKLNPWTVRNELDMFLSRYSYQDTVRFPGDDTEYPGGISFTHDMGVANILSRPAYSSYEMYGIDGCFSHMTHEQLVNWVLCASVYVTETKDTKWLAQNYQTFKDCYTSMLNRDNPDSSKRNGLMSLDSSRAMGGAEITTYDSLDVSLGQARNNIYMAVKCWASYIALEKIFHENGDLDLGIASKNQALLCANTLLSEVTEEGYIPAVLEKNNASRIIPAIEGLVFPYFTDCKEALDVNGTYGPLIKALKTHLDVVLVKGTCLFEDGGWKLSSTSNNSWLSKIYLCQFVAREILDLPMDAAAKKADQAHVNWLLDPVESYHCWSDQMMSGVACGSKYYPRGVTSILWLLETKN